MWIISNESGTNCVLRKSQVQYVNLAQTFTVEKCDWLLGILALTLQR